MVPRPQQTSQRLLKFLGAIGFGQQHDTLGQPALTHQRIMGVARGVQHGQIRVTLAGSPGDIGPVIAAGQDHIREQQVDVVLAEDDAALTAEAGDVLYHLLVMLAARGVSLADVMAGLEKRTAQSGLAEKAGRRKPSR